LNTEYHIIINLCVRFINCAVPSDALRLVISSDRQCVCFVHGYYELLLFNRKKCLVVIHEADDSNGRPICVVQLKSENDK